MLEYLNYRLIHCNLTLEEKVYYQQMADRLIAVMASALFE